MCCYTQHNTMYLLWHGSSLLSVDTFCTCTLPPPCVDFPFDQRILPLPCSLQFNNRLRVVDATGTIDTIAGSGSDTPSYGFSVPATSVGTPKPTSVAVDSKGTIYLSDYVSVRKITCTQT